MNYSIFSILNKIEDLIGESPEIKYSELVEMFYTAQQYNNKSKMVYAYHQLNKILDECSTKDTTIQSKKYK